MTIDDKSLSELIELGEKATVKLQLVEIGDCYYVQTDQGEKMMLYWPVHEQGSEPEAAAVELTAKRGEFLCSSTILAIPLALEVRRLRKALRDILASGTENMTKNYRVVQIDHQTWSDAEEALRAK